MPCGPVVSPVRPSFLPVLEPVPVPTMKDAYMQMTSQTDKKDEPHTPNKVKNSSDVTEPTVALVGLKKCSLKVVFFLTDRCQQQRSKVAAHQHEALGDQADPERHRYQFVVAAFREFSQLSESLIFKYIFVA
jgi:hypothetical protein